MTLKIAYYAGDTAYWITPLVTRANWEGETTTASRSLTLSLSNTRNGDTKAVSLKVGNQLRAYYDGTEFFRGVIFKTDIASDGNMSVTAYDYNHYLTKNSDSRVFKKAKASKLIKDICGQYGIDYGQVDDTDYIIPKLILRDKSLYDMILIALTETRKKTGKKYLLRNEKGKLTLREVKKQVVRLTIADGSNILGASYSESIENLRNSVRYTGSSGEDAKGVTVSNSASIKRYGLMREKEHNGDRNDAQLKPIADALLKELNTVAKESSVEAIGNMSVYAGKQVVVREKMTGLSGGFYVISDKHSFEPNGMHTMSLEVKRSLELTEIEYEPPEDPKKATKKTGKGSKSGSGAAWIRPATGRKSRGIGNGHKGIDIASGGKVPIKAAADGTVSKSYYSSSYGEVIFIKHKVGGKNYETVYAHMRSGSRKYRVGQKVNQGATLGYMGNTGQSFGQHLHFEIHSPSWNGSKSNALNPENYI